MGAAILQFKINKPWRYGGGSNLPAYLMAQSLGNRPGYEISAAINSATRTKNLHPGHTEATIYYPMK